MNILHKYYTNKLVTYNTGAMWLNLQPRDCTSNVLTNIIRPSHFCTQYLTCNIIDNNGSLCSSVVHGCKAVISFLPGRVPNLKLDCVVIDADRLSKECSYSPQHSTCKL